MPSFPPSSGSRRPLRVGYVPLVDSAPLAVAAAEGLFAKHKLSVRLGPEPGWASIREKLIYNELDAAQCLAGLAIALHHGLGSLSQQLIVPMLLNANGNAITLSASIPCDLIGKRGALKSWLATHRRGRPFTLATVLPYSSHFILLHDWLVHEGFKPGQDAEIVFFPPAVVPRNLATGAIDGYCVGEPWNSRAILDGTGWCAATSVDLADGHPEKVLVLTEWAHRERAEELQAFTAAVLEACRRCDDPGYRTRLAKLLSGPEWLNVPEAVLRNSLTKSFRTGCGEPRSLPDFHRFFGDAVNAPTVEKAEWIVSGMRQAGLLHGARIRDLSGLFRTDLYQAARSSLSRRGNHLPSSELEASHSTP